LFTSQLVHNTYVEWPEITHGILIVDAITAQTG